ncbi:substrate-binding domain-containing protein [Paenibacillus alkalitolerans]|uniref:substrate-binding domain-containing protein n=1 Tax=Paenibacillus alkalitolerans TaxID=2799335 RepID=UPI001F33B219|nr:substrate-binding domain-containing protein [Paenibacillus alkalitolerans]
MAGRMLKRRAIILACLSVLIAAAAVFGTKVFRDQLVTKPKKIAVVIKVTEDSMEFWQVLGDGVRAAAKEFGVEADVVGPPSESDIQGQIAIVEQAIEEKPDAIVLAATDMNLLVPVAKKVKDAGIVLLTVDSSLKSDVPLSLIATDNVEAGKKAGQAMADLLSGPSKVAISSYVKDTSTQIERERGVREALGAYDNIEIVGTFYSDGIEQKAYETMKRLLTEHPDLSGIVGLNEASTVGAGKAIRELGLAGTVKLVGFDSSVDEVKLLEEGIMQTTVIQRPFNMGYLSVKTALQALNGEKVPPVIDTGSIMISKDNIYTEENQKLLFPFVDQ